LHGPGVGPRPFAHVHGQGQPLFRREPPVISPTPSVLIGRRADAHRALDDAEGVLGILLGKLPVSKTSVFKSLLNTYDKVTSKISAVGAPFDKKDLLKQRGYRWNDGSQGGCKAWWISVPTVLENEELVWLAGEVYPHGSTDRVEISRVNAVDRFSVREQ
jgi:DNA polymerase-3 subunit epsilon